MNETSPQAHSQTKRRSLLSRLSRSVRFSFRFFLNLPRYRSALVLHESKYTDWSSDFGKWMAQHFLIPIICWPNKGKIRKPENLAILLLHNRDYKTILEQSLDYLGIAGYSVVRPHLPRGVWRYPVKVNAALDFAKRCKDDYILYIDSDDAILTGDPARAIELLQKSGGELLFSTTHYRAYELMPELEGWYRQLANDAGWSGLKNVNLNSGVYVGRRERLIEFLEAAAEYVTDDDLTLEELTVRRQQRNMPEFPRGCGCDQSIFRFLGPRFADHLRLDYASELAVR